MLIYELIGHKLINIHKGKKYHMYKQRPMASIKIG